MSVVRVPLPMAVLVWIANNVGCLPKPISVEIQGVIYKLHARK